MRVFTFVLILTCFAASAQAQAVDPFAGQVPGQDTWFGTFSIIAFDPATNQFGVGVQSRAFGAGAMLSQTFLPVITQADPPSHLVGDPDQHRRLGSGANDHDMRRRLE